MLCDDSFWSKVSQHILSCLSFLEEDLWRCLCLCECLLCFFLCLCRWSLERRRSPSSSPAFPSSSPDRLERLISSELKERRTALNFIVVMLQFLFPTEEGQIQSKLYTDTPLTTVLTIKMWKYEWKKAVPELNNQWKEWKKKSKVEGLSAHLHTGLQPVEGISRQIVMKLAN